MQTTMRTCCLTILLLVLWAVPALAGHIPHIASEGGSWKTFLAIDNPSEAGADVTVTLYQNGEVVYSNPVAVAALSERVVDLTGLAPNAECGEVAFANMAVKVRVGYEAVGQAAAPALQQTKQSGGGVAEFLAPTSRSAALTFYFSDFSPAISWKGIALANYGTSTAPVTLYALGDDAEQGHGTLLGKASASVGAKSRIRGVHTAWFPEIALDAIKRIVAVSSSNTLVGIAISGSATNDKLLFTPAASVGIASGLLLGSVPAP